MKKHHFIVAEHSFIVETDEKVEVLLPSFRPFYKGESDVTDIRPLFTLSLTVEDIGPLEGAERVVDFEWEGAESVINATDNMYEVIIYPEDGDVLRRLHVDKEFKRAKGIFIEGSKNNTFVVNNFLMLTYAFASAPYDTLMFHASTIRVDNKGYLFLGKSGTGKSTHSKLWLENISGAELLNDDNPVVRVFAKDNRVIVYGSPWSGKTPCYKNESVKLGGIIRLSQAPHNKIEKVTGARAFAAILPSCSCLKQDERQYNAICDTVSKLASVANIYKLECLPDKEAAYLSYTTASGKALGDIQTQVQIHPQNKTIAIPNDILLEETAKLLSEGHSVTHLVRGNSMNPFLVDRRDKVVIRSPQENELKKRAFILAKDNNGRYVLHRIIKRKNDQLILMGDGNIRGTETTNVKDIIGLVFKVIRKDKEYSCTGFSWRVYSYLWMFFRPARRYLLGIWRRINK